MGKIPKGWRNYSPVGQCIIGTKFLPFKVPLDERYTRSMPHEECFTPDTLLEQRPKLRAIIDLTNTTRYYDPQLFTMRGVCHRRIPNDGHGTLPPSRKLREFAETVHWLLEKFAHEPDALIGVHCTHGIHRTGFFICYYMVTHLKINPIDAISNFERSRGHQIERANYIREIMGFESEVHTHREAPRRREPEEVVRNWRTETRGSTSSSFRNFGSSRHEDQRSRRSIAESRKTDYYRRRRHH